jgi:hypothetical protein
MSRVFSFLIQRLTLSKYVVVVVTSFSAFAALYVSNNEPHDLMGYTVFTYTFHIWGQKKEKPAVSTE